MRPLTFLSLVLIFIFCITSDLMAERIFYDNFESKAFTEDAWKPSVGQIIWDLSDEYNHSSGGKTCIKLEPKLLQVWEDMWHTLEKPKPAHIRVWFYERGWKNKMKVDQQYLLVGDGTTDTDSANFCQIGQTGNPSYDGHYAIWDNAAWHVSIASSEDEHWTKMEFVLYKDGTATIFIDEVEEFTFPQKWPHVGTIGLASYGRTDRQGVLDGYWDDVEVFDTEEAPPFSVDPNEKLSVQWGKVKLNG